MISLKKFLDEDVASPSPENVPPQPVAIKPAHPKPAPPVLAGTTDDSAVLLDAYQAALTAMGRHGQRAVPALGEVIRSGLDAVAGKLTPHASSESIRDSRRLVEEQLSGWAAQAEKIHGDSEKTIQDLLAVIFEASLSAGTRDEKFGREIASLGERLRGVAVLDNLPQIRHSIMENVSALNNCVSRMADQSRESVRKLTSEIAEYQSRLVASERRALLDPLTGICNRSGLEQQLNLRVQSGQPFSLLVADLNGDEILRQFAGELKAQFLAEDTVARWGGDEFAAIVAGPPKEGAVRVDRVRHWVLGEYKITTGNRTISIVVDAAIGVVAWDGRETGMELFARADAEMYRVKQSKELALRTRRPVRAF